MKLHPDVEKYRVTKTSLWRSEPGKTYGLFMVPGMGGDLKVLACDGGDAGWDHVSVSLKNRCPNWIEMSKVKDLFFSDDETVVQFHPKKSEYVNNHPHCLHLWKPVNKEIELPPSILVGLKDLGDITE